MFSFVFSNVSAILIDILCAMWHIQYSKYGGQSKGCGPSPNVSLSESSRDPGDDYREKPEGRGARQTERAETRRERRTGRTLDPRQLQSWWEEGATPQGHGKGDGHVTSPDRGEWDTRLKGRSVHTHRDS